VEATKQNKEEKRKKPEPEEQEGMPHRQHCPPDEVFPDEVFLYFQIISVSSFCLVVYTAFLVIKSVSSLSNQ
jgi:hypothetical protein